MAKIFDDSGESSSVTLASGVNTLTGYAHIFTRAVKDGTISFAIEAGTGVFKVYLRLHNGKAWMNYHLVSALDPDGNLVSQFDRGDIVEFNLRNLDFWTEPVFGIQIKCTRESGTGDVDFTDGYLVMKYE